MLQWNCLFFKCWGEDFKI